jgi:HD superfamily phosphohydrolase
MNHDPFVCEVRCPVHGFIGLTDLEREIVNSSAFQRLRRIKQLAWTDYVYPGASHSRFEHSLGVMHLASRLYEAVVRASEDTLREAFRYTDAGLSRDWQIVRLAALLHDIGHGPFSHATEDLLPVKVHEKSSLFKGFEVPAQQYRHEDYSVAIVNTLLRDLIEQHPSNRRNYKISAEEITALISKGVPGGASLFWKDIISGQLDADRMDYLLRDSLHAGVSYGRFDLDRIISSVCVIRRPEEESVEPKIAITRGGFYAAEALIVARYWMHKQVYFHKTRLVCDHHLQNAVKEILAGEKEFATEGASFPSPDSKDELKKFLDWDDYRVMGLLASGRGGEHGQRLMSRNHYRLVCELVESDATLPELDASIKRNDAIVEMLGPVVKHVAKPKTSWYKVSDELLLADDSGREQIGPLSQYSSLMKSINLGYLRFVYVDRPDAEASRKKYHEYLENNASIAGVSTEEAPAEAAFEDSAPSADTGPSAAVGAQLTFEPPKPAVKSVQPESILKKGVKDAI